ncbi:MAG: hypothetical protein KGZ93_08035 [Actinobacteria bacterium]|nr:hypothetical protein [Actinomycetota bacterium]
MEQVKKEYAGKIRFETYDLDNPDHIAVANQFGVRSIPTLIFINKDGATVSTLIGAQPKELIVENVERTLKK